MTKSIMNFNFTTLKALNEETVNAINDAFATSLYFAEPSDKTSDFALKANKAVAELNKLVDADAKNSDISSAVESAKSAFTELNKSIAEDWVNELSKLSASTAFDAYIAQCGSCAAFKLKDPAKNEPHYTINAKAAHLNFKKFNAAIDGASYIVFNEFFQTFIRNLNVWFTSKTENGNGIGVDAPSVNSEATITISAVDAKYPDFQLSKLSKSKLLIQLNTLVAHMLPKDHAEIKLEKRHLNYILTGYTNAKDGKVNNIQDVALTNLIVDVIANQQGKLEIVFESKSTQNKESKAK